MNDESLKQPPLHEALPDHAVGTKGSASDLIVLLACPCGKTPKELSIVDAGQGGKWAYVMGDCCGEWTIEFRAQYEQLDSSKCRDYAAEAWNDATRAG